MVNLFFLNQKLHDLVSSNDGGHLLVMMIVIKQQVLRSLVRVAKSKNGKTVD